MQSEKIQRTLEMLQRLTFETDELGVPRITNKCGKLHGWVRDLDDGRAIYLHPQTFDCWQFAVTPPGGDGLQYDDAWDFPNIFVAMAAAINWNGEGEPEGWHRHKATNRYRPGGDETLEHTGG